MTNNISKELLTTIEELRKEKENQEKNIGYFKRNKRELFISIITLFSILISQALIIGLICIIPKVTVILLTVYSILQGLASMPVISEFCEALKKDKDFIEFTTESIEYIPFFLASALPYSLATIFLIINLLGVSIPKIIMSKHRINELNKAVEEMENLIKQKENEEKIKQEKEKEENQDKIINQINELTEKCMLIDEKYRKVFLDNLKCISIDYSNRYENVYLSDSDKIDLDQDNYEKLKSDICQRLGNLDFDVERVLVAQAKVNKVKAEAQEAIDIIDMYTEKTNQSLVLRR